MISFLQQHGDHIVEFLGPFVVLGGLFLALHLTRPDRPASARLPRGSSRLIAVAWLGCAAVHLSVIGEHFEEATVLGVFFTLLAASQLTYAVWVWVRPTTKLLSFGLLFNFSVVVLWTYTRTVAIPFGLGDRETVGLLDISATVLELAAVALAARVLLRGNTLRRFREHATPVRPMQHI